MGKGIGLIDKQIHRNCPYPYSSTNIVITKCPDTYIKTQRTFACYASVGAHDLASSLSDRSTSHNINTDVNDNDDSQ